MEILGVTKTRKTRLCPHREPPLSLSRSLERWARALADLARGLSVSSMTRVPDVRPWCRKMTRTLATRRLSQGILLCRNIQDKAASAEVPRLARSKRAQHMALVTKTAVTQNASQARCVADIAWLGCCSRMASSTASTTARTKGAGLPRIIGVSRQSVFHKPRGFSGIFHQRLKVVDS